EARRLDRIELDDLEVGGQVEIAWCDDRRQLPPEEGRVGRRGAAEETVDEPLPHRGHGAGRRRRQDREADVLEGPSDEARADDLGREPAAELERAAVETARDEAQREEVAGQVEDVLHVVLEAELGQHLVEDARQILATERRWPADAEVE